MKKNKDKTIILFGGSGFLGGHVGKALLELGIVFYNPGREDVDLCAGGRISGSKPPSLAGYLDAHFRGEKNITLINCAGATGVDWCEEPSNRDEARKINATAVKNMAEWCASGGRGKRRRLVHVSTDFVFNTPRQDVMFDERSEPDEKNIANYYGLTKLEGERMAMLHEDSLVARTSWLYGPPASGGKTCPLDHASNRLVHVLSATAMYQKNSVPAPVPTWIMDIMLNPMPLLVDNRCASPSYVVDAAMKIAMIAAGTHRKFMNARGVAHITDACKRPMPYMTVVTMLAAAKIAKKAGFFKNELASGAFLDEDDIYNEKSPCGKFYRKVNSLVYKSAAHGLSVLADMNHLLDRGIWTARRPYNSALACKKSSTSGMRTFNRAASAFVSATPDDRLPEISSALFDVLS